MSRMIPARVLLAAALAMASLPTFGGIAAAECLSEGQARDLLKAEKLVGPTEVQREAARRAGAALLRSRLCRWNAELVYDIILLRPDGRVTHVYVSARDGEVIDRAALVSGE
jgi:uncharacterized membrane protein YkoI